MVEIIDFIAGKAVKLLKGLKSRNTLITDTLAIDGMIERRLVRTTMKSSQFHASLRYVPLSKMNPKAIIFKIASAVKTTMKTGSKYNTILFRALLLSGFS